VELPNQEQSANAIKNAQFNALMRHVLYMQASIHPKGRGKYTNYFLICKFFLKFFFEFF